MNHKKLLLTLTLCLCALLCMVVTASASEVQGHTNHFSCGVVGCQNNDHGHTQVEALDRPAKRVGRQYSLRFQHKNRLHLPGQ